MGNLECHGGRCDDRDACGCMTWAARAAADDQLAKLRAATLVAEPSLAGRRFAAKIARGADFICRVILLDGEALFQHRVQFAAPAGWPAADALLVEQVRDTIVTVLCGPFDDRGRLVVTAFVRVDDIHDGINLNEWAAAQAAAATAVTAAVGLAEAQAAAASADVSDSPDDTLATSSAAIDAPDAALAASDAASGAAPDAAPAVLEPEWDCCT